MDVKQSIEGIMKLSATIVALIGGLVGLYTFVTSTSKNLAIARAEEARAVEAEELSWARASAYGLIRAADFGGISLEELRTKYQSVSIAEGRNVVTPKLRSNETLDKILLNLIADNAITRNVFSRYMVVAMPHLDPQMYEAGKKQGKIYQKAYDILKAEPGVNDAKMLTTKIQLQLKDQEIFVDEFEIISAMAYSPIHCEVGNTPKLKLCVG